MPRRGAATPDGRSDEVTYPIRAAARMTGLSVDTLRAWERRYEAVVPGRDNRGRRYSEHEVARLRRLAELVAQGHPISTIAKLQDAELVRLLDNAHALAARTPQTLAVANLEPLGSAVSRYDLDTIESILNRHAAILPPRELVFSVVLPLLRDLGDRWERQTLRPGRHLVSAIVRSVLAVSSARSRPLARRQRCLRHAHGRAARTGTVVRGRTGRVGPVWRPVPRSGFPADDIVHAATTTGAPIVIVSLTEATRGRGPQRGRRAGAAPGRPRTLVGGPEARVSSDRRRDGAAGRRRSIRSSRCCRRYGR